MSEPSIEVLELRPDELEARIDGRRHVIPYVVQGSTVSFSYDGNIYFVEVAEQGNRARKRHREHHTSAPMPGMVLKILVREGDVVAKGAPLLILEAMKMEHQIAAPYEGRVVRVNCTEGELVQPGVELVELEELSS